MFSPFALLIAPMLPACAAVQEETPARVVLARHERCATNERLLAFLDAWALAEEGTRVAATELLIAARPRGGAVAARPDIALLVDFAREHGASTGAEFAGPFVGKSEARQVELQALADQIDLAVVPGAFGVRTATGGGKGEPIIVHVHLRGSPKSLTDADLGLIWVGPAGRQLVARREPISVSALTLGFPMYIRPPASEAGMWRLAPELTRKGATARGVPVPVECVDELTERATDLGSSGQTPRGADAFLRRALADQLELGARASVALSVSQMLALLERRGDPAWPVPVELAFRERGGLERWTWAARPAGEIERTLVLLGPVDELSDLPFAGEVGASWLALAERHGTLLLSCALPPWDADVEAPDVIARLPELARELGAPADGNVIVVARGDAATRLTFVAPEPPFDAAVLSAVVAVEHVDKIYPDLPRLLVAPGGAQQLPDSATAFVWLNGATIPLLNDARLPELVRAWLDLRAKVADERGR